jgi:hypothetical protein
MQLIEHVTVGPAGAAEIQFNSIPSTFDDLVLLFTTRSSGNTVSGRFYLNNDTTMSNYYTLILYGSGSGGGGPLGQASTGTHNGVAGWLNPANAYTANVFQSTSMYFPNYKGSAIKTVSTDSVNENNGTQAFQLIGSTRWNNTSAITSIRLLDALGGSFLQNSIASLYGVTKGSSGGVTVS